MRDRRPIIGLLFFLLIILLASTTLGKASQQAPVRPKSYLPLVFVPKVPDPFNKYGPADGSVDQPFTVVLSWTKSNNFTHYEYCIDATNDGNCYSWVSTGTNNYVQVSGLQNLTTYYWQVRAWNGASGPVYANGAANAYWSFKTILGMPSAFNKNAPRDYMMGIALNPVLSWTQSSPVTRYEYCIDTTDDNACSNWISTGTNTYVGLNGLQQDTWYYWQVRAWNGNYGPTYANGSSTAFWSFLTLPPEGIWVFPNYRIYNVNTNGYLVLEILNNTSSNLEDMVLTISTWDAYGNRLSSTSRSTFLKILHAGEYGCTTVRFSYPSNFDHLTIDQISYYTVPYFRPRMEVTDVTTSETTTTFRVRGTVWNREPIQVNMISVVHTYYSDYRLLANCTNITPSLQSLPAGGSSLVDSVISLEVDYPIRELRLQTTGLIPRTQAGEEVELVEVIYPYLPKRFYLRDPFTIDWHNETFLDR